MLSLSTVQKQACNMERKMWKQGKGLCRDMIQNRIENGNDVKLHKKNKNLTFVMIFEQM